MESKYTRAQIEEKLDTVFDSVLQTKDVEVTGDMEITPDDGFLGLKKVNITAKGGGESGGNIEYWKHESNIDFLSELGLFFIQMKYDYNGTLYIASMIDYYRSKMGDVHAFSIDRSMKILMEGTITTVGEFLSSLGLSDFSALGLVQITEEEFYTI